MDEFERKLATARHLLGEVRKTERMAAILPFLSHVRGLVREAEQALAEAGKACVEEGRLDDALFSKVYTAGALCGRVGMMCEDHRRDPSDHVRLACAAATVLFEGIKLRPTDRAVVETMRARLNGMS